MGFRKKTSLFLAFVLVCFSVAWNAWALNVQSFRPKAVGGGVLTTLGSTTLEKGSWAIGGFYNWAHDTLDYSNIGLAVTPNSGIVKHMHTVDFLLGYGLTDWMTLHLDIPMHFLTVFDDIVGGTGENKDTGVGDLEFSILLRLIENMDEGKRQFGFAFLPFITARTGVVASYVRDEAVTAGVKVIVDRWLTSKDYMTFNFGYINRPEEKIANLIADDALTYGLGYQRLLFENWDLSVFAEFYGSTRLEDFAEAKSSPMELLGGLKKRWESKGIVWTMGAGRGFHSGYGTPDIRAFTGFVYSPPLAEEIIEEYEPPTPPAQGKPPAEGGLTLGIKDAKGNDVEAKVFVKDEKGKTVKEFSGSSAKLDLKPGEYTVEVEAQGYKSETDKIEIIEGESLETEILLTPMLVKVGEGKIEVSQVIYFDPSKATIKDVSEPLLDEVVGVLKTHPEIKHLRIEGYTDDTGSEEYNIWLSGERAKSVANYLVEGGIDKARVESKGFGPANPIASNETREGRAKNRRVEFVIVEETEEKPK